MKNNKYIIIKEMKDVNGKVTTVLVNDSLAEIFETSDKNKATRIANMFNVNSDSGWTYLVRTINII